jgi:hypothetical protein
LAALQLEPKVYLQVAEGARILAGPRAINLVVRAHERAHTGLNGTHERLVVDFKFNAVSHVCGDEEAIYLLVVVDEVLQEKHHREGGCLMRRDEVAGCVFGSDATRGSLGYLGVGDDILGLNALDDGLHGVVSKEGVFAADILEIAAAVWHACHVHAWPELDVGPLVVKLFTWRDVWKAGDMPSVTPEEVTQQGRNLRRVSPCVPMASPQAPSSSRSQVVATLKKGGPQKGQGKEKDVILRGSPVFQLIQGGKLHATNGAMRPIFALPLSSSKRNGKRKEEPLWLLRHHPSSQEEELTSVPKAKQWMCRDLHRRESLAVHR